jgi:hypothetical protein
MKKIELGQMITILANVGVIAGIAFLAVELRQNNAFLEAEAGRALTENRTTPARFMLESSNVAELAAKLRNGDSLDPAEEFAERSMYQYMLVNWEWEFREYRAGRLSWEQLPINAWSANMNGNGFFPTPRMKSFWNEARTGYDAEFAELIDTLSD